MSDDFTDAERSLEQAQDILEQARDIMRHGRPKDDAEEWLLLATIIGEADLAFRTARLRDPTLASPLLDTVVEEFYEMTAGFTDPVFLRSTRAARRRNKALFG